MRKEKGKKKINKRQWRQHERQTNKAGRSGERIGPHYPGVNFSLKYQSERKMRRRNSEGPDSPDRVPLTPRIHVY